MFIHLCISIFLSQFLSIGSNQPLFDDLVEVPMNCYIFTSSINFVIYFNGNFIIMYNDILPHAPKV